MLLVQSMKSVFTGLALAMAALGAQAAEPGKISPFLGGGVTFGGDTLATVEFVNGPTEKIRGGGLVALYGGAQMQVTEQMVLQASMGYHVDDTSPASNGSVRFSRYPIDVLALFSVSNQVRLGGGVQVSTSPKLTGSGAASNIDLKYKNSAGAVIEGEYLVSQHVGVKLRFVAHKYKEKITGFTADGNHIGLTANWYF
jgi:hypothetical protein